MKSRSNVTSFKHPLLLGFENFDQSFEQACKQSQGYPPYNIERREEGVLRITLAVAGFGRNDLTVQAGPQNQLVVRGKRDEDPSRLYLYRGIANRQFQKIFLLADGMKVREAILEDGLIHIELEVPLRQERIQTVPIVNKSSSPLFLFKRGQKID